MGHVWDLRWGLVSSEVRELCLRLYGLLFPLHVQGDLAIDGAACRYGGCSRCRVLGEMLPPRCAALSASWKNQS